MKPQINTLTPGIKNEDYQAADGIGSSTLKTALDCPALYRAYATGAIPWKETPAKRLGTLVHLLMLEAHLAKEEVVVAPKFGRKDVDKADKKAFYAAYADKLIVNQEDHDKGKAMCESLLALPDVRRIMDGSQCEHSGWYVDPETDLLCKYRPDIRTDWCMADVKTCKGASPAEFGKAVATYQYHLSAAHYLTGDEIITGTDHRQFVFLCVESKPPYLTAVYPLADRGLQQGEWERRKALGTVKRCQDADHWPSYNDGTDNYIDVPYWAQKEFDEAKEKGML